MKSFVTLAVVGAVLLCIGVLVLVLGVAYAGALVNQCEGGGSGCSHWWLLASAAPGGILAGIGLVVVAAALVCGLRRT